MQRILHDDYQQRFFGEYLHKSGSTMDHIQKKLRKNRLIRKYFSSFWQLLTKKYYEQLDQKFAKTEEIPFFWEDSIGGASRNQKKSRISSRFFFFFLKKYSVHPVFPIK